MGGDYLAMQKDWMNAPPQIGVPFSLFPTNLSHSLILDVYYLYYAHERCECFNHADMEAEGCMAPGWIFVLVTEFIFRLHFLLSAAEVGFMIFSCK